MEIVDHQALRANRLKKPQTRRADGHRHLQLHRDRRRRAVEGLRYPGPQDVRLGRDPRAPTGKRCALRHEEPGPGPRDHLRADRRRGARHLRLPTSRSRRATPTPRRTACTYASRSTPTSGAARRSRRARSARRRRRSPRTFSSAARPISSGSPRFFVKGVPQGQDHPGVRVRRVHQHAAGHGAGHGGDLLLRPAQPHLPVRQLHLRGRHRPRHRRSEGGASSPSTTAATSSTR